MEKRIEQTFFKKTEQKFVNLCHLQECHEVHPLVLRLLQQSVDPSVVSLHPAEGVEVADHGGGEAGNAYFAKMY